MANYTSFMKDLTPDSRRDLQNQIERTIREFSRAGKKAMEDCRKDSVISWFRKCRYRYAISGRNLARAVRVDPKTQIVQDKEVIYITFTTYIDEDAYKIKHTHLYESWMEGKYPRMDSPTHFIVSELQWEQGILGLPEKSSEGTWVNENFFQAEESMAESTPTYMKWRWRRYMNQYYDFTTNKCIKH